MKERELAVKDTAKRREMIDPEDDIDIDDIEVELQIWQDEQGIIEGDG